MADIFKIFVPASFSYSKAIACTGPRHLTMNVKTLLYFSWLSLLFHVVGCAFSSMLFTPEHAHVSVAPRQELRSVISFNKGIYLCILSKICFYDSTILF